MRKLLISPLFLLVLFLAGCINENKTTVVGDSEKLEKGVDDSIFEEETVKKNSNVEILTHKISKDSEDSSFIIGEVQNTGEVPVSFIEVTATFYDEKSEIVDTDFTFTETSADSMLKPQDKDPFKLYLDEGMPFDGYKLDVTWDDEYVE